MLTPVDEQTRECLAIVVAWRQNSDDGLDRLSRLFATRGVSELIRGDHGPELTAKVERVRLELMGVKTLISERGIPGIMVK